MRWTLTPRQVQIALAALAVFYLLALWLVPQWVPGWAIVALLVLALLAGVYTFWVSSRPAPAVAATPPASPAAPPPAAPAPVVAPPALAAEEQLQQAELGRDLLAQCEALYQTGAGVDEALQRFDAQQPQIAAGHALAVAGAEVNAGLAALAVNYPLAGANVLAQRQPPRARTAWVRAGYQAALRLGGASAAGAYLMELAGAYQRGGQSRRASGYYGLCVRLARAVADAPLEAAALANLGQALASQGRPLAALVAYQQQLKLAQGLGHPGDVARSNWNIGLAYAQLGDLPRALAAMQTCLDYERETGQPEAEKDAAILAHLRERHSAIKAYWTSKTVKSVSGSSR